MTILVGSKGVRALILLAHKLQECSYVLILGPMGGEEKVYQRGRRVTPEALHRYC